ncbi:hypothetical protein HRbin15_02266 [bacterium HR15]|nr:hypothetical protein HRbin15_02266 [bacterium HR15]
MAAWRYSSARGGFQRQGVSRENDMAKTFKFTRERQAFAQLKHEVENNPGLREDIEQTLQQLLGRFATSIRENRFIVGGVLEVILVTALRAAGVQAQDVGMTEQRIDIKIPQGGFSVKGHFSSAGDIRLINVLGASSETAWETATIFVLHKVGIGYADPELIGREHIRRATDAIVLRYTALRNFLEQHPQYLIQCAVPSSMQDTASSELVSRVVAKEILKDTKILVNYIP